MVKGIKYLPLILLVSSPGLNAQDSSGTMRSIAKTIKGDVTIGLSYLMPQGNFADNAEDGGQMSARLTSRKTGIPALSLWLSGSASFFGEHTKFVTIKSPDQPSTYIEAKRRIDEYVFSLHFGFQIGSPSRRATIRPRIGTGLGFNAFITDSRYYWGNLPIDEDNPSSEIDQVLGRWGWHSVAGFDIYIKGNYGVSLDLTYDQIWHIDITDGPASFLGIGLGYVYTFR